MQEKHRLRAGSVTVAQARQRAAQLEHDMERWYPGSAIPLTVPEREKLQDKRAKSKRRALHKRARVKAVARRAS